MWRIWMKCYPQPDEDMTDFFGCGEFKTWQEAETFCKKLEKIYADEGWAGHWLYGAKFYAELA